MKWISVKDKLPEVGKWVLIFSNSPEISLNRMQVAKIELSDDDEGYYWRENNCEDCKEFYVPDITHWTFLPDAPEDDE